MKTYKEFIEEVKKPVLVKDKVTGKLYDPWKEFDKLLKKPEVIAQFKRMGKEQGKGWVKNKNFEENVSESKTHVPEFKDMVNAAVNYHAEGDVDKTRKYIQAATANLKLIPASELKALGNTAEKKVYDSIVKKLK